MKSKIIMVSSAAFMAVMGLVLTFAPDELVLSTVGHAEPQIKIALQLLGALYLSFAMTNWMTKDGIIGGIYNRPVAIGNFLHFLMGGLALARLLLGGNENPVMVIITLLYTAFAIAFYFVVFRHPKIEPAN